MRHTILAGTTLLALSSVASAGKVLVLKSEGNADAATRAKVDAEILKLAHSLTGAQVEVGEVTFTDAAVAVGCSGNEAQCRDDVLGTMGVDEVVSISVAAMPSGDTHIVVDRIAKGSPTKAGQTTVPAGQPVEAKIESDIGPSFGVKPPEPPPPAPTPVTPPPAPTPTIAQPAFGEPGPTPSTEPPPGPPMNETPLPNPPPTDTGSSSRGPVIGLAVGGGLVVLSIMMWAEASNAQSNINNAPTKTVDDFQNLQNLESTGATYANLGNVFFVGGLVVAGVSGYFFWRNHRAHASASQAMVTPTLFDHGAGLALTIGGSP
jgi:hypothetical protein